MGRKAAVSNEDLIAQIGKVFREVGYEGASLSMLSKATGLQRASLYHRYPGGKEQMATEVLEATGAWLTEQILKPLKAPGDPAAKIQAMLDRLDEFYAGGRQACLLNMLSSSRIQGGPFTLLIHQTFDVWIATLSEALVEAGLDPTTARQRAERTVMLLQGSLVLSRGMGSEQPFRDFLKSVLSYLLGKATA